MRSRNCNLELRLVSFTGEDEGDRHHNDHLLQQQPIMNEESTSESPQQQKQQLTIFYNGAICVCNVTHLQAKALIELANKEIMEDKLKTLTGSGPTSPTTLSSTPLYSPISQATTAINNANYTNNISSSNCSTSTTNSTVTGLSMKRSLRRFLQKRMHRIQASHPYHHRS